MGNKAPSPDDLLREAKSLAAKSPMAPRGRLIVHARAIEVLKRKGYNWVEMAAWFNERGVFVKYPQSLAATVKRWGKTQDYIDFCAEEDKESALDEV